MQNKFIIGINIFEFILFFEYRLNFLLHAMI